MEFKPGDKIRVTQDIRAEKRITVQKVYKVVQVYPNFITIDNGKYKSSIHLNDIETGEVKVEKIKGGKDYGN